MLNYFIALIFSIAWSAKLFFEWGTDFGVYYAGAMYLDQDYALYGEFFDHKGPAYYLFLRFIGLLIGWGPFQAYISLLLTTLVYLLPLVYIINVKIKNRYTNLTILLLTFATFFGQSTNISITLFQSGLSFLAFYFLIVAMEKPSHILRYWFFSTFFYFLTVLTRIDAIIYIPLFFIALIFLIKKSGGLNTHKDIFIALIGPFLILCGLFASLSYYFGFTLDQFIQHNITFNNWYAKRFGSTVASLVYRPNQFQLISASGILISLIIILSVTTNKLKILRLLAFRKKGNACASYSISGKTDIGENNSPALFLGLVILILGFIGLIISRSDKDYHTFIFITPAIFFISYWGAVLKGWHLKYITPVALYAIFLAMGPSSYKILKNPYCLTDVFCSASPAQIYERTVNEVKKRASFTIVGGRGWPHVFSKSKPERAINDSWLYTLDEPFVTSGLKLSHDRLLISPPGTEFWIDNSLIEMQNKNPFLEELIEKSMFVENQGPYWKYKIK